jgi:DNA repair protein RadC
MSIKNLARHEMPREKLIEKGSENLRDHELMAILLGSGMKGKDVCRLSRDILKKYPAKKLLSLNYEKLSKLKGLGPAKACLLLAAFELTKRALETEDNNLPTIRNAKDAVAQLQELRLAKKEHFVVLYLNARNQLVHKETISIGTLNASLVHPREFFYPAIENLACSIIAAIAKEEILRISRHYKKEELLDLFPGFEPVSEKTIEKLSPSGFKLNTYIGLSKKNGLGEF